MIGDQTQAPDLIQEVTAWRTWKVENSHLKSMSNQDKWGGQMKAECYKRSSKDPMDYDHKAPFESCGCGLYGFYEYEELLPRLHDVVGVVKYWGECQAHQIGLRAEHAQVVAVAPTWRAATTSGLITFSSLLLSAYRIKRWSTRHRAHFHLFPNALHQYHTQPMPQSLRRP